MTVFVVSQPYSGMVLAKGMFRLIGTCAGALVSIGMVALYGQASLPFLLLMALWLAFCTAGGSAPVGLRGACFAGRNALPESSRRGWTIEN